MSKKVFLFIFLLALSLCIFVGCGENSPKGGEGCGMFDNATKIKISYNKKIYEITDSKKIKRLIKLCREDRWSDSIKTDYSKEDCQIKVEFIGARATLWLFDNKKYGMLDNMYVTISDDIYSIIIGEIKEE